MSSAPEAARGRSGTPQGPQRAPGGAEQAGRRPRLGGPEEFSGAPGPREAVGAVSPRSTAQAVRHVGADVAGGGGPAFGDAALVADAPGGPYQ